jgi:hypothetical protein
MPFLGEGWPMYWETILDDKGFFATPAKKVGTLFWRIHRAARIIFSPSCTGAGGAAGVHRVLRRRGRP